MPIRFEAKLFGIDEWTLLRLPKSESAKLPSRGMVMVVGTTGNFRFQTPLEPDGRGSHWFKVDKAMLKAIQAGAGDTLTLEIDPVKDWPEPKVPADLLKALKSAPEVYALWKDITPMARWDWIRWIGATKNPETRKKRIEVELSKLRPCR
ncbi:MAG TPA: YdeI/OmpD-associated family protein [Anaerolineales bacterium]|nr:YdeI/OmpD-associated family protein [Anaerolineales bacterium]